MGVAHQPWRCWLALAWGTDTGLDRLVRDLAIFGVGFGLTVSPRATVAVDAAGATAYGVASALLQVTRTIGMSVGLALLTSIGQNRIDELSALVDDPGVGMGWLCTSDVRSSWASTRVPRWPSSTSSSGGRGCEAADVLRQVMDHRLGVALATLVAGLVGGPKPAADDGWPVATRPASATTISSPQLRL